MRVRCTIAFMFFALSAAAQDKVYISGFVNELTTLQPLSYVNISVRGKVLAATDQNGFFTVVAAKNDTLVFTRLGFKPHTLVAVETHWDERIFLQEMSRMLDEVIISDRYKFQGHDEMEKSLDEDSQTKAFENITANPQNDKGMVQTFGPGATLTAPWGNWNKEAREQKRLQAVLSENQRTAAYNNFIHSMAVEQFFMETFSVDHPTYLKIKEGFIISNPDARYLTNRQDIVDLMVAYFATKRP